MGFVTLFGIVSGVVTLVAICLAIYQTVQAKRSDVKLEETRNSLAQLEKNLATSDLKLIKAVEYYNNGHFDDSLKAFRGYIKDTDDISEINSAINKIFWKESKKIYGKYFGVGTTPAMLVVTIISKRNDIEGTYPDFLVQLLGLASAKEGNSLDYYKAPVFLNLKDYDSALKHLDGLTGKSSSQKSNKAFREYVKYFCEYEIKQESENT